MKPYLLNSIKRLITRGKRIRRIAIGTFILGALLIITAYVTRVRDWDDFQAFITLAFVGYILIISSAALLLVNLLREWSGEAA